MSAVFQERFQSEKRKAFLVTWAVDSFLIFYFFFMAYYLSLSFGHDVAYASEAINPAMLGIFAAAAFPAALLWGWYGRSPGVSLVYRTNRYLKGLLRDQEKRKWWQKPYAIFSVVLLVGTFVLGYQITDVSFRSLLSVEGLAGAKRIFTSLMSPNWSIIGVVITKMLETIFLALLATAIAIPAAFLFSFFCAKNLIKNSTLHYIAYLTLRTLFSFIRSVEPVIWAIIFSVWVGIGPFAGMLALMLHSVASLTKQYSEQIESIDDGPLEAMEATGGRKIHVVWHAVVPQVLTPFLSFTIYRWDINIRMATIIGLVGGGGVGSLLMQYQGLAQWNEVGTIIIVITVVVWMMDLLSSKIRAALV